MARTRKPSVKKPAYKATPEDPLAQNPMPQEAPREGIVTRAMQDIEVLDRVEPRVSQTPSVALVEPDPLHPTLSAVFLIAAQRLFSFARSYPNETQPEPFVRQVLARLCLQDPTVKVLVAVDVTTGETLGHLLASIESNGVDRWAFCWQAESHAGVLQQMIDHATPWAKQQGASHVLMATQIDPRFWEDKYGFETVRHVMKRTL